LSSGPRNQPSRPVIISSKRDAEAVVAVGGDAELQADHRAEHHERS